MPSDQPATPRRALLLSRDRTWIDAAAVAASRADMALQVTASPTEAMVLLTGMHGMCRLLVDVATAGPAFLALTELTCGEVDSGVDVIVLGRTMARLQCLDVPDVAALTAALAQPDPFPFEWQGQPPLEAGQILRMMRDGSIQARFQPIVHVRDRSLVALEVLARLHEATCSILPPHRFIPQLEQAGLGADLLRHVSEAAFSFEGQLGGARLALNVPLGLLNEQRTVAMLTALRERAGVPAFRVLIELTESQVVEDVNGLDPMLEQWRDQGYRLAIDDAGPAVPRYRDMFELPFDWVKLDKSVIRGAMASPAARQYMADTVASAHRANLAVVAEGIETQETWDLLRDLHVDCGQGFMIARPMPAGVVPVWRAAWAAGGGGTAGQFPS